MEKRANYYEHHNLRGLKAL